MENFEDNENVLIQDNFICKSISGEEDENGNYKFEVEASNENLDLQNQYTMQTALEQSEEFFITNGVISDDHLHKTRNPDGTVETHKEKIIGEPISVRFDPESKKTFVKGILYSGIKAAKPYIDLLKNKSRLVKASIGGIMPHIIKNSDGTETVTSFMWNDLALTTSPVNWTVGPAKFAKSISAADFCKSLEAGTNGSTLQKEDLEDDTKKMIDITDGNVTGDDEDDDLEKSVSDVDIIRSCVIAIDNGELIKKSDIESFLMDAGFDMYKAKETTLEIINQGGTKMQKSHFSSTIDDLLKSIKEDDDEKEVMDSENEEDNDQENTLFDDDEEEAEDDDVKKGCVKKSLDETEGYLDATELVKSMGEKLDALEEENAELRKSLEEVQENMIEVTKSFGAYLKTPNERKTVVQKSMNNGFGNTSYEGKKPTNEDFDVLKKALVSASSKGEIGLEEVQFYNAEFQKAMAGKKVDERVMSKIFNIVRNNR